MRMKLCIMRAPVTDSNMFCIRSRSRNPYMMGVIAPRSMAYVPMKRRWLASRFSSARMTRMYCPRSGGSMPMSRSAARQKISSLFRFAT